MKCWFFLHKWTAWEKIVLKTIWHDAYFGTYSKTTFRDAYRRKCLKCGEVQSYECVSDVD